MTAAVAVELVHNFSLLHDDIMDNDTERRHRPTAWTVFGVGAAILAGDALLALAQDMLLEDGHPQGAWAARCLSAAVQRLIGGQGSDLAFEKREDVTLAECLDMAGDKTAALMACACSIGAVHLGAPPALAMGLAGFGAHVGLAFQLTDDLLGIWGAPEVTGKPVRADLRARKKSLPVVAALTSGTPAAGELRVLLGDPEPLSEGDLVRRPRGGRGGRPGLGRGRSRHPARRGQRQPGRHRPGRRRPGRTDRDRRIHHGAPMVKDSLMFTDTPMFTDNTAPVDLATLNAARDALARARDHALGLQDAEGWWQSGFETNVTMDAEDLLLREFLGLHDDALIAAVAAGSGPSSGTTAPGPTSTAGRATCPPRSRPTWRCGWPLPRAGRAAHETGLRLDPGPGRARGRSLGVHPDLAGAVRPVVLGRPAGHPA